MKKSIPYIFLIIITIIIYYPGLQGDFIDFDDLVYVKNNYLIHNQTFDTVTEIFSRPFLGTYWPLTLLSYQLDSIFFGNNPFGYHALNLCLHILNGVLLIYLLKIFKLENKIILFVSTLFFIHPLNVESVTWISERKNLLTAFFAFLYVISFYKFLYCNKRKFYVPSLIFFILSLLSKSSAETYPFLWLLIESIRGRKLPKKTIAFFVPFLLLSVLSCISIIYFHSYSGGMRTDIGISLIPRMMVSLLLVWLYVYSVFNPFSLSPFYENISLDSTSFMFLFGGMVLLSIFIIWVLYRFSKKGKILMPISVGLLFFVGSLLPVLNIIPISVQRADRYIYASGIGLYVALAILILRSTAIKRLSTIIKIVLAITIIIVLSGITYGRQFIWSNSSSYWKEISDKTYPSLFGKLVRSKYLKNNERYVEALHEIESIIKDTNLYVDANIEKKNLLYEMGRYEECINWSLQLKNNRNITYLEYQYLMYTLGASYFHLLDFNKAESAFFELEKELKVLTPEIKKGIKTYRILMEIFGGKSGISKLEQLVEKNPSTSLMGQFYIKKFLSLKPYELPLITSLIRDLNMPKKINMTIEKKKYFASLLSSFRFYTVIAFLLEDINDKDILLLKGKCLLFSGKIEEALLILNKLRVEKPKSTELLLLLMKGNLRKGNLAEVQKYIDKIKGPARYN
jgi:protein O-mannosyl-transferase